MTGVYRILHYVAKYRGLVLLNLLCNILSAAFSLFSVVMVIPLLQLIFDQVPDVTTTPLLRPSANSILDYLKYLLSEEKHLHGPASALLYVCIAISIIILLKNTFRYLAMRCLAPIRAGVVRDLRIDLFERLVSLPLDYYTRERKGDLITRMTDDIRAVEASIISMLEVAIREPLNIILSLGWMMMMSAKLTFFVLAMLVVIGGVIGQIGKTLKRRSTNIQDTIGRVISTIEETISGLRIIQAYQAESYKRDQFQATNESLYRQSTSLARRYELSSPLTEFLAISVFSLLLWFGGGMVLHHEMEAAAFFGFIAMFSLLIQPAKSFSTAFYSIRIGLASAHRVFEILDAHNTIVEHPDASPIPAFQHSIDFDRVCFSYSSAPDRTILSSINLPIAKGKTIAIVGPSGAGKTTLVDLLPRFYDVREGAVRIDGVDIREFTLSSLRAMIAIVSQEPILFNDTVYQNITLGKSFHPNEVMAAARIANAHDFIQSLEAGYDTMIGDRGGKLSGGERQRLTIARAVLKNSPILILDEATSSLDAASERLVQDALYKLMQGRTTIVIAHRLATIQGADEIIVMNEGNIVQRGTHHSLMAVVGLYAKLVELQAFE